MISTDELQVNIMSVEDIRAKLPEARRILKAKEDALDAMNRDVRNFSGLVSWMAHVTGEILNPPWEVPRSSGASADVGTPTVVMSGVSKRKESPAQDRAIAALKRAGRPMAPTGLFRFMKAEGLETPANANALGAALWNAHDNGRIKKTPDGLYALLGWEADQPELAAPSPSVHGDVQAIGEADS